MKKVIENAAPSRIQAHDLTVEHSVLHLKHGKVVTETVKTFVRISFAGHQLALAIPDMRQRPEAVVFQFKQEVGRRREFARG